MRLRWPSRCTFRTWAGAGRGRSGGNWAPSPQPSPPRAMLAAQGHSQQGCTHVDKLQLPEVLHSVNGAVATRQEGRDIVLQAQGDQPGVH